MAEALSLRHCAYCLKELEREDIKRCARCHRRVYCSKECQKSDWQFPGQGQGHKNWCSLECGEEDLDWYVAEVPGKGLGVIAKRKIPPLFRIMVDCDRSRDFPAVQDLMPRHGSLQAKFHLNALGNGDGSSSLCLRISRVNHSCRGNSSHYWDPTFNVKILFSEKEIQPGEEITFAYVALDDQSSGMTFEAARGILTMKWGITCPPDCVCHDTVAERKWKECARLDRQIMSSAQGANIDGSVDCVRMLLRLQDELGCSFISKWRTLYDGFQVGIMKKKWLNKAVEYMRASTEIITKILHPQSEMCVTFEGYVKNPRVHRNYMVFDTRGHR